MTNLQNRTALWFAVESGKEAIAEILLNHDAAVNKPDTLGATALAPEVKSGTDTMVQVLLTHGVDPFLQDLSGWTLHWAAKMGHLAVANALLQDERVDHIQVTRWNTSALHYAARYGGGEVLQLLV
ncbi:ankyrin repeat-containing domain protein [Aspergillus granulosus]|uniref:Ankyrin repeat-containing domain protein n=1 Tax=Aspergillus granulosus TaxID=176169 RepID=A0ABR4HEB4_9EURO